MIIKKKTPFCKILTQKRFDSLKLFFRTSSGYKSVKLDEIRFGLDTANSGGERNVFVAGGSFGFVDDCCRSVALPAKHKQKTTK